VQPSTRSSDDNVVEIMSRVIIICLRKFSTAIFPSPYIHTSYFLEDFEKRREEV
jgi:hypothetical protein